MYPRGNLEYVQKYYLLMRIPTFCLNNNDSLTDLVGATSYSLGMEMYFRELTIDFPTAKTQWISHL